jgi:prepilin-type N-terminal cleavage/methylation domain-containing protein/prepilin-type processing-associated H-X9-DG protein
MIHDTTSRFTTWVGIAYLAAGCDKPPVGRRPRSAFTLVELLVVIAIIAILAGMMLAGVSAVRSSVKSTQCMVQLRHIGIAQVLYAVEWKVLAPSAYNTHAGDDLSPWWKFLSPYTFADEKDHTMYDIDKALNILTCPTFTLDSNLWWKRGYAQNICPTFPEWKVDPSAPYGGDWVTTQIAFPRFAYMQFMPLSRITEQSSRFLVMDHFEYGVGPASEKYFPHRNTANVLFYDLHVAKVADASSWTAVVNPQ